MFGRGERQETRW